MKNTDDHRWVAMNVLLANMPIKFNARENLEPPLGISYIGAVLKEDANNVYLRDYEVEDFNAKNLEQFIKKHDIQVIGVSFRTASYKSAKKFTRALKDINPGIKVVLGGQHTTAFPKETLRDMAADIAIRGEGEYVFRDLIRRMKKRTGFEGLNGITYVNEEYEIVSNGNADPIKDIDALPMPFRDGLALEKYNVITVITSRGCPFNCIYCDKGVSTRIVKYRSPERIFQEIRYIVKVLKKNRLYIVDDYFLLNRKNLENILDRIIEEKMALKWTCQARVDGIDKSIIEKAKKAGCEQIMFGIESGDERELEYMRKGATNRQAEEAVSITKEYGITARANFMLGFPISTIEMMRNTVRFAKKIRPDIVRFFAVAPLPNTDLWRNLYGDKFDANSMNWDSIDFFKPNFDTAEIKKGEISLYVSAAYWYVLKADFLREISVFLLPNILKLFCLCFKTGRIRGNISRAFPRSVNLLLDNAHQLVGLSFRERFRFLAKVWKLEKVI